MAQPGQLDSPSRAHRKKTLDKQAGGVRGSDADDSSIGI
jgi:hypothetical protein